MIRYTVARLFTMNKVMTRPCAVNKVVTLHYGDHNFVYSISTIMNTDAWVLIKNKRFLRIVDEVGKY